MLDHDRVLVGVETRDDAGAYALDENTVLVFTTDFFTPVVDEAYDFGRIAAANALSDVYAMGARPLMALNLVAFPSKDLPMEVLGEILRGGSDKATEAGIPIVGGHSIDDPEPKYGLAVVGLTTPAGLLKNQGARPGDQLLLTKPLGSGVMTTAIKRDLASTSEISQVTELMAKLNRGAGEVLARHRSGINALTDVTGFGLLGHLLEMLEASGVGATLQASAVPVLEAARRMAGEGIVPGGTRANLESVIDRVEFGALDETTRLLLADAQTSGGLLASVHPDAVESILADLKAAGTLAHARIGEVTEGEVGLQVLP
jgi:selenide,water dikinase